MSTGKRPLLSIVITSYTIARLKDILELLSSLKSQTYPYIEIVFVAERSSELCEKVKAYAEENGLRVKVIYNKRERGLAASRNLGVKHAEGDIIGFLDDDAVPSRTWAEQLMKSFSAYNDVIGVTGPALPLWEDKSLSWFPKELYWIIGCSDWKGLSGICYVEYAWGVNMAFRKKAFSVAHFADLYTKGAYKEGKVGPVGDDIHFSFKVKRHFNEYILYNPRVKVWHKVPSYKLSSKYVRRYAFWQGYSDALFKNKFGALKERLRSERHVFIMIICKAIPSIFVQIIKDYKCAIQKLRVITESLVYFSLGYVSYLIPGLIHVTKYLV